MEDCGKDRWKIVAILLLYDLLDSKIVAILLLSDLRDSKIVANLLLSDLRDSNIVAIISSPAVLRTISYC